MSVKDGDFLMGMAAGTLLTQRQWWPAGVVIGAYLVKVAVLMYLEHRP